MAGKFTELAIDCADPGGLARFWCSVLDDINPTDREQDEEVRRLLDLGARHADVGQGDVSWVVLADSARGAFLEIPVEAFDRAVAAVCTGTAMRAGPGVGGGERDYSGGPGLTVIGGAARMPGRTCSLGSGHLRQSPGSSGKRGNHARQRYARTGTACPAADRLAMVSS